MTNWKSLPCIVDFFNLFNLKWFLTQKSQFFLFRSQQFRSLSLWDGLQFRLYRTYRVFFQFPTAGPALQLYWYHGTWSYSKSSSRTLPRLYDWDFCLASGCLRLLTSFQSPDLFLWKNRLKDWAKHEFLGCYFWNDSLKKTFFLHPFFLHQFF